LQIGQVWGTRDDPEGAPGDQSIGGEHRDVLPVSNGNPIAVAQ
jgi:hypothetical protein